MLIILNYNKFSINGRLEKLKGLKSSYSKTCCPSLRDAVLVYVMTSYPRWWQGGMVVASEKKGLCTVAVLTPPHTS